MLYEDPGPNGANVLKAGRGTEFQFEDGVLMALEPGATVDINVARLGIEARTDETFGDSPNERTWDSSGAHLQVLAYPDWPAPGDAGKVEAFNVDFGEVWFCDNDRMKPWAALTVAEDATAKLVDDVENQFHGAQTRVFDTEAVYVEGSVWVKGDAVLTLGLGNDAVNLITTEEPMLGSGADILGPGDVIVVPSKTCYGDFDNDGDVDEDDRLTFCSFESGSGNPTTNVLVDYDLDGDVDDDDAEAFSANYNGEGNDPRCACFPGGPGEPEDDAPNPLCE